MNIKRLAFLLPVLCIIQNVTISAWAQRQDGLNITDQSFAYSGDLDALYMISSSIATAPSKKPNVLHVMIKNGKFRMSFTGNDITFDTIVTKDRTLSQQGGIKYNFNKSHPESLIGMPPLPVNFESFKFLKVKPESFYILQAGSSYGLAKPDASGKNTSIPASDRSYFSAEAALTLKDSLPLVTEIWVGNKADPLRTYRYSAHQKIGGVWLPGRIECQSFFTVPPAAIVYTLKSLHTAVGLEKFDYDRALKKGDLVQSDNGKSVASFTFDPTQSLEEQHGAAAASAKRIDDEVSSEQKQRRYNSSTLLLILGVGLMLFWYVRRRMNRAGSETPYSGEQTGV